MNEQELDELEQELRAGLRRHADDAVVNPTVLGTVRAETGRRRRTRWVAVGAAAAVVVAVGVGTAAVIEGGNDDRDDPPVALDLPAEWRPETWGGLTVDVPADWGYGAAPGRDGVACGAGAVLGADGGAGPGGGGWVGRPIGNSDMCSDSDVVGPLDPPYVWLGADIDPGVVDLGDGVVQETVEAEGATLTVATDDAALRREILDSARAQTMCEASLGNTIPPGEAAFTDEGRGALTSARVCVYKFIADEFRLAYAAAIAPEQAAAAYAAQEGARVVTHDDACMGDLDEYVLLDATYDDPYPGGVPLERRAVYAMGCGGEVDLGDRRTHLVADGVTPWSTTGGIGAIVRGPSSGRFPGFYGIQG